MILLIIISDSELNYAQVTTGFNFGGLGDYVGWNGTMTPPLEIRHNNTTSPEYRFLHRQYLSNDYSWKQCI